MRKSSGMLKVIIFHAVSVNLENLITKFQTITSRLIIILNAQNRLYMVVIKLFNYATAEVNKILFDPLQQIQNFLVRTVIKSPRFSHITPFLKSLH